MWVWPYHCRMPPPGSILCYQLTHCEKDRRGGNFRYIGLLADVYLFSLTQEFGLPADNMNVYKFYSACDYLQASNFC